MPPSEKEVVQRTVPSHLELVQLNELEPGDEFVMLDADIWRLLEGPVRYRDLVKAENMQKGVKEAALRNADARWVVKVKSRWT